ncbi:hypothetical protein NSQ82_20710 [Caldifermentibacillus hisashii]|uniref:hypothetical protein n=1 Tax=Caldifermentibacillus hisashii TaxID=996558 RepID=UPI0031B691AE
MPHTIVKERSSRVSYYELAVLANGGSVRTFDKKIYHLRGVIARNVDTGEVVKLSQIYYKIRTAINKNKQVVAKRKNADDELRQVSNN